ncbi:hypothetical protein GLOTRDRAFT_100240 [Gloeophyllum trabeum ATCC 11539]|uniref:Secreted protein n=1 Tax=Gloeophyllum trabeum (strain ATCC 11539 / FP-39264 / Madison 617) TaxID=670483 RepID=S7RP69_GLOTA|nr:uncharacterized protein GLOTRDRAFT_100240 [Gloeophyllum trabeum ATCC 11539]EPQ54599.1 hypothetical protein GLOTRDRAFT_100240 [Gloeophyllum trabeum ATCC 11539]
MRGSSGGGGAPDAALCLACFLLPFFAFPGPRLRGKASYVHCGSDPSGSGLRFRQLRQGLFPSHRSFLCLQNQHATSVFVFLAFGSGPTSGSSGPGSR